jgi:phospho-N-acetylmuramoyl-pentapeptide-transferase
LSPEQLNHYGQANLAPTFTAMLQLYGPGILAFSLTALIMPWYIGRLKQLHIDQQLREEGPKSHAHKAKTPTMGGLCFMLTTTVSLVALAFYPISQTALGAAAIVFAVAFLCGVVGLLDDSAKVQQKANKGISAKLRLATETILGLVLGFVLSTVGGQVWLVLPHTLANSIGLHVPVQALDQMHVCNAYYFLPLPVIAVILLGAFLVAATTNAVNLHDGMDGLAAGTATLVFATLAAMLC